jgi:hypothetical protein
MASPSRKPTPNSRAVLRPDERPVAKRMAIRQAKAAMKKTKAQPWLRLRPAYPPSAKNPAVAATSHMTWPNRVRVRSADAVYPPP